MRADSLQVYHHSHKHNTRPTEVAQRAFDHIAPVGVAEFLLRWPSGQLCIFHCEILFGIALAAQG